jgi:hypothetical protein
VLDKANKLIASVSLIDDIDSVTQFVFTDTQFLKNAPVNKFIFKKQKNDEVLKP